MKVRINAILNPEVNKQEFIDSFDPLQVELWNPMIAIDNLLVLDIEESFVDEFSKDSRVCSAEQNKITFYPSSPLPEYFTMTKNITVDDGLPTTEDGGDYTGAQFYLDTDLIYSNQTLGWKDDVITLNNKTYFSRWTGKNVDIVSIEVGPVISALQGIHDTHPDFEDIENPGNSKIIPMNWTDLEAPSNSQVASNSLFTDHSMGVLSVAAGTICGFAKKANLYVAYIVAGTDDEVECVNAIVSWHNSKPVNPSTGVKNPTILISEYQPLAERLYGIKIDDINSITDSNGTVTKPGPGWGTDFTPFTSRNVIPFRILDPVTSTWEWCIVFPIQAQYEALKTANEAAWDAGITVITPAGNNGGVYVKYTDSKWSGVYCTTVGGTVTRYLVGGGPGTTTVSKGTTTTTTWYPFRAYGPAGLDKAIDVAAGQNSETIPILDAYSNRGPGIDISGLGQDTWSAYPIDTYSDGNYWGAFSGTSCAAPTVVGKAACMMERYFNYTGTWPTNDQVKSMLLAEAKSVLKDSASTTWSSVPSASTNYQVTDFVGSGLNVNRIQNGVSSPNGGFRLAELAGTNRKRAFLNAQSFSRSSTQGKRPPTGAVYPRSRIKRT
jgi:hypothetical protein